MTSMFLPADIQTLIATFPPPLPTGDRPPTLVKSFSGNSLYNSEEVLARFRRLLETSPTRIKRADVPSLLGVRDVDWIFDCCKKNSPLASRAQVRWGWSKNRRLLVPTPEVEEVLNVLSKRLGSSFVHLGSFDEEFDVSLETLHGWSDPEDVGMFASRTGEQFVSSLDWAGIMETKISKAIAEGCGGRQKVELSVLFDGVPDLALLEFARKSLTLQEDVDGSLGYEAGDKLVFVPSSYDHAREEEQQRLAEAERAAWTGRLLQEAMSEGFCEIPASAAEGGETTSLQEVICARYNAESPERDYDDKLMSLRLDGKGTTLLVRQQFFTATLMILKSDAAFLAPQLRQRSRKVLYAEVENAILATSPAPKLASLLLRSSYCREKIQEALRSALDALEKREREELTALFHITISAPLHLYTVGLEAVKDATLKQHLDGFLAGHFRHEVSDFLEAAHDQDLLNDKARSKEADKLSSLTAQAKTIAIVQTATSKLAKTLNILVPSSEQLTSVQRKILRSKLTAMEGMVRGSDVLQNSIWILLAQRVSTKGVQALFMSSGKDTSRMIKLYQSFGDAEMEGDATIAERLVRWRDELKGGLEREEDLLEMRALAKVAVEELGG